MASTFRIEGDGSVRSFSGGFMECLAWKGIIDPDDPALNVTDEERKNLQRVVSDRDAFDSLDLERILDVNKPLEKEECNG